MKIAVFRIVSVILLLCLMTGIFVMSGQNAEESQDLSDGFTLKLFRFLIPGFKSLTLARQREYLETVFVYIRKVAHFGLYFMMGLLAYCSVITYTGIKPYIRVVLSFAVCVLYSASDEYHQTFIEGRSGEIRDVLIDSSGALLAIILLLIICISVKKIKTKLF